MNLLNVGCGSFYVEGWVNTDVFTSENVNPDVVIDMHEPLPFDDDFFDAVYVGHVLEHVAWESVQQLLLEINRVVKPGCPVLVVGPDIFRVMLAWRANNVPWQSVLEAIEHADWVPNQNEPGLRPPPPNQGPAGPHLWNCHEERVMAQMVAVFDDCVSYTNTIELYSVSEWKDELTDIIWPIVVFDALQFAILGYGQ